MTTTVRGFIRIAPLAAMLVALPGMAQYKVVSPDGRVTYTDTPPPESSGARVTRLGTPPKTTTEVALPLDLRQAITRYPVTLYTMRVCDPCDAARLLLRQRGVPYSEKVLITSQDSDALLKLSGARDAPTVTIGSQVLRGLSPDTWHSYLDLAGYPRQSRLPAAYEYPAPTPLTEPPPPPVAARPPAQPAPTPAPEPAPAPSPSGITF